MRGMTSGNGFLPGFARLYPLTSASVSSLADRWRASPGSGHASTLLFLLMRPFDCLHVVHEVGLAGLGDGREVVDH